jgi:hypothetical protein
MNCSEWIIAIASGVTAVATVVIARYAVISHRLAESNQRLTEELGRTSREMDKRNIRTLQHLAAATLGGSPLGGSEPNVVNRFKTYLKRIQELAVQEEQNQ